MWAKLDFSPLFFLFPRPRLCPSVVSAAFRKMGVAQGEVKLVGRAEQRHPPTLFRHNPRLPFLSFWSFL